MPFRVIVAGSRAFTNYDLLRDTLDRLLAGKLPDVVVISGCAPGADTLGERYAAERCLAVERHPADWEKHGRAAGPIRNREMAEAAGPGGGCVLFWDGKSRGTLNMLGIATNLGLQVRVVYYDEAEGTV